ncbi:hypothetical protein FEM48_Zijuj07G0047300 [Ziziphus jujuba var. spinosa]|uniref:Pentatricopeptide repeat-containing protein n=1 Tax=Ziziphus jujuba var. spinosa TaxID=714518 RepID=A0A978V2I6_ZIZJJ|nr:hypothetical protein FEM48_Zijuj07G0047300 [Ziziphus jujuba var. spinosa]
MQLHALILRTHLSLDPFYAHRVVRFYAINGDLCPAGDLFDTQVSTSGILALVTAYSKLALVDEASTVFNGTPKGDFVMWNSMISAYGNCGFCYERLELFSKMQSVGAKPDGYALVGLLSGLAESCLLNIGQGLHNIVNLKIFAADGRMANVGTGLGLHGLAFQAFEKFEEILEKGLIPDESTFSALLCTCCRAGLVKDGKSSFKRMTIEFCNPTWDDVRKSRDIVTNGKPRKMPGLSWIEGIITL